MEEKVRWRTVPLSAARLAEFIAVYILAVSLPAPSRGSAVRLLVGGTSGVRWYHRHNVTTTDGRYLPAGSSVSVDCVGLHPISHYLYWLDRAKGTIFRQREGSTSVPEKVVDSLSPRWFTVDWIFDNLFWLSNYPLTQGGGRLYVSRLDGSLRRVLHARSIIDNMKSDSVAVDPYRGLLFISHFAKTTSGQYSHAVSKLLTNGSIDRILRLPTSNRPLTSLVVDLANQQLFWIQDGGIWKCSYHLLQPLLVWRSENVRRVVVGHGHAFFVENTTSSMQLHRMDVKKLVPGAHATHLHDNSDVHHIAVEFAAGTLREYRQDFMSIANCTSCQYFCVANASGGSVCLCPSWSRVKGGLSCSLKNEETKQFLVAAGGKELQVVFPKLKDARGLVITEPLVSLGKAGVYDVAVDRKQMKVYWTNEDDGQVGMSTIENASATVLESAAIGWPQSIAVDYLGKNIFWTDGRLGVVETKVATDDGMRKMIMKKRSSPRGLTVNPVTGFLFWTEFDSKGSLWRSSMSGHDPVRLLDGVKQPITSLVLEDLHGDAWLYFLHGERFVEKIRQNGTSRQGVYSGDGASFLGGLAVSSTHIFVSVKAGVGSSTIRMIPMSKGSLSPTTDLVKDLSFLGQLVYVNTAKDFERNKCSRRRLRCEFMCLQESPKSFLCHCPSGIPHRSKAGSKATVVWQCPDPKRRIVYTADSRQNNSAPSQSPADDSPVKVLLLPRRSHSLQNELISVNGLRKEVFACNAADNIIYRYVYDDRREKFSEGKKVLVVGDPHWSKVGDLSTDWTSGQLFWTDTTAGRVETAVITKSVAVSRRVLLWNLTQPELLTVHPTRGLMFFTASSGCLFASSLSGHIQQSLGCDFPSAKSLVINVATDTLFLGSTHSGQSEISIVQVAGLDLLTGVRVQPKRIPIGQSPLLLTTWGGMTMSNELIFTSADENGQVNLQQRAISVSQSEVVLLAQGKIDIQKPQSIAAMSESHSQAISVCSFEWVCAELCLVPYSVERKASDDYPQCYCPAHKVKQGNNCSSPNEAIIIADGSSFHVIVDEMASRMRRQVFQTVDLNRSTPLPIVARLQRHVEVDWHRGNIYWIDEGRNSILMSSADGREQRILVNGVGQKGKPVDIAVNPLTGNVFWSCGINHSISVVQPNGQALGEVVEAMGVFNPTDLAIDPHNSEMFWVDKFHKYPAEIRRAPLDVGDRVTVLLCLEGTALGPPTSLAVAHSLQLLFWIDSASGVIYYASTQHDKRGANCSNGAEPQIFVNMSGVVFPEGVKHIPGSLAVVKERVYWTYESAGDYSGLWLATMQNRKPKLIAAAAGFTSVALFATDTDLSANPCLHDNGKCSHFCIKEGDQSKCGCPSSMKLNPPFDIHNCISKKCKSFEFPCESDGACQAFTYRCDGENDCQDGSDERNCSCENNLPCQNGVGCYKKYKRCDGRPDCSDRSDEAKCHGEPIPVCAKDQLECDNIAGQKICVPQQSRCDGQKECANGMDETNCGEITTTMIPKDEDGDEDEETDVAEKSSSSKANQLALAVVSGVLVIIIVVVFIVVVRHHFRKPREVVKRENSRKALATSSPSSPTDSVELSTSATDTSSSSSSNAQGSSDGGKSSQRSEQTEETVCKISPESTPSPGSSPKECDIFDKTTPEGVCPPAYRSEYHSEAASDDDSYYTQDNTTYDGFSEGASIVLPRNPPPSLVTGVTSDQQSVSTYNTNYTYSMYSQRSQPQQPTRRLLYTQHTHHGVPFEQASITDGESMFSCEPMVEPCPSMITDTRSYATESIATESAYAPCPSYVSGLEDMSYVHEPSIAFSTVTSLFGTDTLPPPPPGSPAPTCLTQSEVSQSYQ